MQQKAAQTDRQLLGHFISINCRHEIKNNKPKLKASPVGIARTIKAVIAHMKRYGPRGVPNGFVEAQKLVNGKTPCLPHSRIILDLPRATEIMFPKELRAIRKFNPRTLPLSPRTFVNHRLAVVSFEFCNSCLDTAANQDTFVSMYKTYTVNRANEAFFLSDLTGFFGGNESA